MSQCPLCRETLIKLSHYHEDDEYFRDNCEIIVIVKELEPEEIKQIRKSIEEKSSEDWEEDL